MWKFVFPKFWKESFWFKMSEEEDANNESSSADAKLKEENHIVQYLTDNKNVLKVIYRKARFDHF